MKKTFFFIMVFFSFTAFSLEKSKIKEYDQLDFSNGEITAYYDKDSNIIEDKDLAMYYRKVFSKNNGTYLIVDFYRQTDSPRFIFRASDPKNDKTKIGKQVSYSTLGDLLYIADMKNGQFNGNFESYKDGKVEYIVEYINDKKSGIYIEYSNDKKVSQGRYKDDLLEGDAIFYNSDGSESVRAIYKNDKLQNVITKNYKIQKTGIPEYDNLDVKSGKIFSYYNSKGLITPYPTDNSVLYRKILKIEEDGLFLVADFLMHSDDVIMRISKVKNPKDNLAATNEGYSFLFKENGYLSEKSSYKNGKLHGKSICYNAFGIPDVIKTYTEGKLTNIEFLNSNLN